MEILFCIFWCLITYIINIILARWFNYILFKLNGDEIDYSFWFCPISSLCYGLCLLCTLIQIFSKKKILTPWFKGELWNLPSGMIPFNPVTCPVKETFEFYSKNDSDPMIGYLNSERTHVIYDKPENPTKIGYRDIKRVKYYKII